ncbi:MAG: HNH endonuclease [Propionibacteriaceae bacterium]|jgi:hypothetical protein|nr:HNH endonuclease [Propionibacteriaceae bacterium]
MTQQLGARAKLRHYFLDHVGEVLTSDTLREVAGISEWARRVRELRNDEGYQILSHHDRSDLKPWEYVLEDPSPQQGYARTMSKELRAEILDRDGHTCQSCGAVAGEPHPYDGRVTRLQIGHIKDKSMGGTDEPSNLVALCSVCNEGASNITLDRPTWLKLEVQIRRATRDDQLKVLGWLVRKYSTEAREMLGHPAKPARIDMVSPPSAVRTSLGDDQE